MSKTYDAIVIGGGHNALITAIYLARAGRSVLVVEAGEELGGTAISEELAPGFRCSAVYPSGEQVAPEIVQELKLAKHGLRFFSPGSLFVPRTDGRGLFLPPPARRRRKKQHTQEGALSGRDAVPLAAFDAFLRRLADAFATVLAQPLPELESPGLGGMFELLRRGWRLRRLGAHDLAEAMRFLPMPIADVLDERFENDALKALIASGGVFGSWLGPRSPGSALNLLLHRCGHCRGALPYPELIAGGSGGLIAALIKACQAAGVELRTGKRVEHVTIRRGQATGVVLDDGSELRAATVASGLDPKTTLLDLVGARHLEPQTLLAVNNIRCRGTVAIVQLALDRLPQFRGAPEDPSYLAGRIQLGASLDEIEQAFDDCKYGRLPQRPLIDLTLPSITDPYLAPKDKLVLHAWVQYAPYPLREGHWDDESAQLAKIVERRIADFDPSFPTTVQAIRVLTPLDLERRFGLREGCLYHVEPALDQMLYMRPLPGWGQHRTTIEGLYLCGSGTHGGGGLSGLAGRNAARQMLKDRAKT